MLTTCLQRVWVFQSFGDYWRATGERKFHSNRSKQLVLINILNKEAFHVEGFEIEKLHVYDKQKTAVCSA